jgi:hypothetical protein
MTPVVGATRGSFFASRMIYHVGRIAAYGMIGLLFGAIGQSIVFAGFQRWLSIGVGVLMLLALIFTVRFKGALARIPMAIKSMFGQLLYRRSYPTILALGATNGLLPCGLVYMAATASIATGSSINAMAYMILFGAGTLPILVAISVLGNRLPFARIGSARRLVPFAVASVAILLIVRGNPASPLLKTSEQRICPLCSSN